RAARRHGPSRRIRLTCARSATARLTRLRRNLVGHAATAQPDVRVRLLARTASATGGRMEERPQHPVDEALLAAVEAIAERAGAEIRRHYQGAVEARAKADASPVTVADEAAEAVIVPALEALTPEVPVVSEEAVAAGHTPAVHGAANPSGRFWLVDPLDGTKE